MKIEDIDTATKTVEKCKYFVYRYNTLINLVTTIERAHGGLKLCAPHGNQPNEIELDLVKMDEATRRILAMALTMEAERIKKQIEDKQLPC